MRRVRTTIENVDETVTKSIVIELIKKFNTMFKLADTSNQITLNQKDFKKNKFNIGNLSNSEQNQNVKTLVNIKETIQESHVSVTRVRNNNTRTLVGDKPSELNVNTLYVPSSMELNIVYFSKSQTQIENLASVLKLIHIQDKKATLLNIFYRFYATTYLNKLLISIHEKYVATTNDDITLEEFLSKRVSNGFTLLSNVSGTKANIGFQQYVTGVLGRFTSDILNTSIEYDKQSTYWSITFDFNIQYDKPLYMDVMHDVSAYNHVLEDTFLSTKRYALADVSSFTKGDGDISNVNNVTVEEYLGYSEKNFYTNYITIPEFDTTPDLPVLTDVVKVLTVFVTIDDNPDNILLNLSELGEININAEILKFIRDGEHKFITDKYQSLFHVQLFANRGFVEDGLLKVTEELNVLTTKPLNKTFNLRVALNVITDLTLLPKTAIDRINANPEILTLTKRLLHYNYNDVDNGNVKLSKEMIKNSGLVIAPVDETHRTIMKTVQVSHIVASLLNRRN